MTIHCSVTESRPGLGQFTGKIISGISKSPQDCQVQAFRNLKAIWNIIYTDINNDTESIVWLWYF